jgi:hypothetical protein
MLHEPQQDVASLGLLQVEAQAALVAVEVLEIRPVTCPARRVAWLKLSRHFDLDDIGTPVSKLPDAGWARADAR